MSQDFYYFVILHLTTILINFLRAEIGFRPLNAEELRAKPLRKQLDKNKTKFIKNCNSF